MKLMDTNRYGTRSDPGFLHLGHVVGIKS